MVVTGIHVANLLNADRERASTKKSLCLRADSVGLREQVVSAAGDDDAMTDVANVVSSICSADEHPEIVRTALVRLCVANANY